jgi:hypothetical protein
MREIRTSGSVGTPGLSPGVTRRQYGQGHHPGLTYDRDSVEVATRITSPSKSLDEEMRLIARLRPRDNLLGQPDAADETIPF